MNAETEHSILKLPEGREGFALFHERPQTIYSYEFVNCSCSRIFPDSEAKSKIDVYQMKFCCRVPPYGGSGDPSY